MESINIEISIDVILAICALVIGGLIYFFINKKRNKEYALVYEYNMLLKRNFSEEQSLFSDFHKQNQSLSRKSALIKFYSIPENYERASKSNIEYEHYIQYTECRNYARKYEEFIFWLFSPLAEKTESSQWVILNNSIPDIYIIDKIKEYYKVGKEEATKLFDEFVKNSLLLPDYTNRDAYYSYYTIGLIFSTYNNIVSKSEMNLSKWIDKNGKSKSKKEIEDEVLNSKLNPFRLKK